MSTSDDREVAPGSGGRERTEDGARGAGRREGSEMETAPWYDAAAGRRLVAVFVVLTLLAAAASVSASGEGP